MITSHEYIERLKSMKKNIYMGGELVERVDPRIMPGINVIALTYDLVNHPDYKKTLTATSHITGKAINRFTHMHQSQEDLLKKQEMTRLLTRKSGFCIQRCMGIDAMNALSVATKEIDDAKGTEYHQRFLEYLRYWQEKDITGCCAQTDAKGDRSLRPHQQPDPDLYVRVVEKKKDGIVVRGAKQHITTSSFAEEIVVVPTRALKKEDADYAVAFGIPSDSEGVYIINRASSPRKRNHLNCPLAEHGSSDGFIIFDNVFVPWNRVFMCGEYEFGGRLALLFALFHRHSYTGCKPAVTDIIMGLTALVAEYNGVAKAQHIREKLADLMGVAELVYGAGIAGSINATKSLSGTFVPDPIYCNVGRRHAGENIYHEHEILTEIAGGLPATLPYEDDFFSEQTKPLLDKYMVRKEGITAEDQQRCFRCISDLNCSAFGAVWQYAGVHGGGSPIMETIAILSNYNLELRKNLAKELAGIKY
ncbi:4-hydroxyphenylacetate 3-hydroxylase family protein [Desulfoscipio sp. XC116]|uniref:4-hydroxyphenylacetate 3-hydroxylase family protein n=1 Tax=Desulfoscipio sp. XC116 TaxID=3144975 RepID=UPI00325A8493